MANLLKPVRTFPLPADAEIVTRDDRRFVRLPVGEKRVLLPVSRDGTKYLRPAKKWYGQYTTATGRVRRVPLAVSKAAADAMLEALVTRVENERAGKVDRLADERKRPLVDHLEDWKASLAASGRPADYLALKLARVNAALDGCGWVFTTDFAADRLESFLHGLRTGEKKLSIQTSNDYLQAVRQFCRWLVANGRLADDPFKRLKPGNAAADPNRRRRGELTPDEVTRLLRTTAESTVSFRGLGGTDRAMIYRVALGTGFRAAELAALVPNNFDLTANPPAVVLPAEFTKNRRGADQPISEELAATLAAYLAGRPGKDRLWPGTWATRSADMLKADLAAAGVAVTADGPEGTEVRDFHALRGCYVSNVIRAGADLKQAMTLARHSDPRLTMVRYARTRLGGDGGLGAVVNKLPTAPTTHRQTATAVRAMTGTDPRAVDSDALPDALEVGKRCTELRRNEKSGGPDGGESRPAQTGVITLKMQRNAEIKGDESGEGGIRTRGAVLPARRFSKDVPSRRKSGEGDEKRKDVSDGCTAGCTDGGSDPAPCPDLAKVVAAWPTLPPPIRRALLALVAES
jgi:integrase